MSVHRKVRVALVGAGRIAGWHLRAYARDKSVSVIAIANPISARGRELAQQFSIPRHFQDYRKMIEIDELDAVDICAPIALHKEMVVASLERGLHVYCEKPLCATINDLDEIIELNRKKERVIFNGYNLRLCSEFKKIEEIVRSGELGKIRFVSITRTTLAAAPKNAHILLELSSHYLDLLDAWGFGKPTRIHVTGGSVQEKQDPDSVVMSLEYGSGVIAVIVNSLGIPGLAPEITLAGTRKVLHLRYGKILLESQSSPRPLWALLIDSFRRGCVAPFRILRNPFFGSCEHFIDCIRHGRPSPQNEVAARASISIAEQAMIAMRLS